jgi:probable rRNA maturation factor
VEIGVAIPRGWARKISAKLVRSVVGRALETEGWDRSATLEVLMMTDSEMREVNATRRGVDEATDVLSFPLVEMEPGGKLKQDFFVLPPEIPVHLGDIILSVDRIEQQAKDAGHSTDRELAYLTVHGVLHILGYDHQIEVERRAMRRREEEVLASLGLRRAPEG